MNTGHPVIVGACLKIVLLIGVQPTAVGKPALRAASIAVVEDASDEPRIVRRLEDIVDVEYLTGHEVSVADAIRPLRPPCRRVAGYCKKRARRGDDLNAAGPLVMPWARHVTTG